MSQITSFFNGTGSGTVASVTGGVGINITGNPSLNPTVNLDVPVTIAHGGTNAIAMTNTNGVNYFDGTRIVTTLVGTPGQILTSQGIGLPPIFTSIAPGGVISVSGTHGINVTGIPATPIVAIDNTILLGDLVDVTGTDALTVTSGDITLSSGSIYLPVTTGDSVQGVIYSNGQPLIQAYGLSNAFFGQFAGNFTTTGTTNVALGQAALESLTTGSSNVALGVGAGEFMTTGQDNVIIGHNTADNVTTGFSNVIIGADAATNLLTGQFNIIIGDGAGADLAGAESNNILIANNGDPAESSAIRIGDTGTQTTCYVAGIASVVTANSQMVTIDTTTNQLGSAAIPSGGATTFNADSGSATPAAGAITISGGLNIDTSGATSIITVAASPDQYLTNYNVANASPYVVTATDFYITVDTSTIPITIQLPDAPTIYRRFVIKDSAGNASIQNVTVTTVSGVKLIDGATTFVMNTNYQAIELVYDNFGYQVF